MKNKKTIVGSVAIIIIFVVMILIGYKMENGESDDYTKASVSEVMNKKKETSVKNNDNKEINAQIFGAVKNPGVYSLKGNSMVKDLVNSAGGFSDNADKFSINGAAKVLDGANIYVKAQGENVNKAVANNTNGNLTLTSNNTNDEKLDINTATVEDIVNKKIKGVGEGIAKKIVDYREKNGGKINSVEDLQKAIGKKRGQDLMEYVNIN
ncbi:ComEA family DNA-binding protein [Clostridium felsineum]|uniref:ComE operon protein 1 n=1 Tax=Clostridium felsineum TaxID=36839 RepID=A0A1S8LA83_9CLOT|nr:ComEA family DNA-binding protein [Clostridium felsineum]MCR3758215.1 ComEA family DNA-binding protein [Clostridium felsineum]URZ06076.1 ComE operon protein 1 [Clostridium felsineum]URZ11113.1 ComE operon protein 1 [Clostridium felsineum]